MTPAHTRKAAERARKRALGLVPVEVWILPTSRDEIRAITERDKERATESDRANSG